MFKRIKFLQVKQLRFEQTKEVFHDSIIQAVPFAAHTLADAFGFQHPLILFVLVLPSLIRVKD